MAPLSQVYVVVGFRAFWKQVGFAGDLDDVKAFTSPESSTPITDKKTFEKFMR